MLGPKLCRIWRRPWNVSIFGKIMYKNKINLREFRIAKLGHARLPIGKSVLGISGASRGSKPFHEPGPHRVIRVEWEE
jgi:hypothetical protein